MSKFETICDVLKSDGGPVIFGTGAITLLVGGYYFVKGKYRAEVKTGDASATLAPVQPTAELAESE